MSVDPEPDLTYTGLDFTSTTHVDTYPFVDPTKLDMSSKAVLVTGASKGIGRCIALAFASAGASHIAICARSDMASLVDDIAAAAKKAGRRAPKILPIKLDVTDEASVDSARQRVEQEFGRLDILVNNAGYMEKWVPLGESNADEWWKTFTVNVKGPYLCARAFLPLLLKGGDKTIINISSIGALITMAGASGYQTTKLALLRLSEFLSMDYAGQNLLCYSVHPGSVMTELSSGVPEYLYPNLADKPELAGDTIAWLASQRREWLQSRYVSVSWDMPEFEKKREEIEKNDLLKVRMAFK